MLVANAIMAGLGIGAIYAVIAVGYTLIISASGIFNFAQGSAVMAGALISYALGTVKHWPVLSVIAVIIGTGALIGLATHVVAVLPLVRRSGVTNLTFGTFLSTLGLGLVFDSVISIWFGDSNVRLVNSYVSGTGIQWFGVSIRPIYLVMLGSAALLAVILEIVLRKTSIGLVMRAVFNDVEGASLIGISISKVVSRTFAAGCVLAALAGFLVAPITLAHTGIADQYAFYGFAAMAIGGFGSLNGAMIGGLVVGLVGEVPLLWVGPNFSGPIIYATLLAILLVRPQGIFGSGGSAFGAAAVREV